jgi:hypothetical protein
MITNGVCKRYKFESVMLERTSIMENNRACIIIEPAHAIHEKKKGRSINENHHLILSGPGPLLVAEEGFGNYKEP